ncbi:E3 binding domain-containing protein [Devosia sp. LjRoot16]|uniref:E3 binding domain-containing protein n=1 Tax=Devosia sp. LjRoot16 TaxID=3342271 RepID=UPI003ECD3CBB
MAATALQPRRAASPYARRLARERGLTLEVLTGSGPNGRIVAADVAAYTARPPAPAAAVGSQASALGTTIQLATLLQLLAGFADADTPFTLEDVVLRAAGCALDDVPESHSLAGAPVALEQQVGQLVFADIRKGSLGPLRARRLAAVEAGGDQSAEPAALSLKLLAASDIRPVMMPLKPGRNMRLVLAAGPAAGECLLSFDAAVVSEDAATELLTRFKAYLELPLRLLA